MTSIPGAAIDCPSRLAARPPGKLGERSAPLRNRRTIMAPRPPADLMEPWQIADG